MPPQEYAQQEEEGGEYGSPYSYDYDPRPNVDEGVLKQTDPKAVADKIKHALKGEDFNEDTGQWEKLRTPLINDLGLASLMVDIREVLNQNTTLSYLDDKEVENMIVSLGDSIAAKIMMRYKEWEISKAELTTVHDSIVTPTYLALKRCWKQGERNWFKTAISSKETHLLNAPQQEKKGGMFGWFKKK